MRWHSERGLVCATCIFASSESKSVAAIATCCAALKAMNMRMPTGHIDENVPKRLMKPDMLDMLESWMADGDEVLLA